MLCYIAYFLMLFLSGASFPQEMLPEAVRKISALLPLTHAVNVLRGVFRGAPWEEYQPSVFVLCGVGLACALGGALLYRKKNWA